jgi:hypothetical protein
VITIAVYNEEETIIEGPRTPRKGEKVELPNEGNFIVIDVISKFIEIEQSNFKQFIVNNKLDEHHYENKNVKRFDLERVYVYLERI